MPWMHKSFWIGPLIIAAALAILSIIVSRTKLQEIYKRQFGETRRERLFLASVGFFTAVLVVRGITLAIHNDVGPFHNVSMHGRHIHHLGVGHSAALTRRIHLAARSRNWIRQLRGNGQDD